MDSCSRAASTSFESVGPAGGPKEFTITFEVDDPFLYDPSLGNLLLDFDLTNGSDLLADHVQSPALSSTTKWIVGPLGGSTAFAQFGGIITEFTLRPIPEPLRGDFDMDGDLDANDIDLLSLDVHTGGGDLTFDLNDDGLVDQEDRNAWVENVFGTFFGDADLNKTIELADFLSLANGFDMPGGWANGDFDGNGTVLFPDFLLLSSNFGKSATAVAAVPEPNAAMLLLVGLVSLVRRRSNVSETRGA